MKKKILSLFVVVAMTLGIAAAPITVMADDSDIVSVGTATELTNAINQSTAGTIIALEQDIELTASIELKAPKNFTIDGRGYKISCSKKVLKVSAGSNVTLNNITLESTGGTALDVVQGKVTLNGDITLNGGGFYGALTINGKYSIPAEVIVNGNLAITKGMLGKSVDMSGGDNCFLTFNEDATVTADKFAPQNGKIINNSKQVDLDELLSSKEHVEIEENVAPAGKIANAFLNPDANNSFGGSFISVNMANVIFDESVALKVYSGEEELTSAVLNTELVAPEKYPELTGFIGVAGEDQYWSKASGWAKHDKVPTEVKLVVDGEVVDTCEIKTGDADHGGVAITEQDWYDFAGTLCVFGEDWTSDDENHWKECVCGEKETAPHEYVLGKCVTCGYVTADREAADKVDALIDAIGPVDEITLDSFEAIDAAAVAYNNLTDAQKKLVSGYDDLLAAYEAYEALLAGGDDEEDKPGKPNEPNPPTGDDDPADKDDEQKEDTDSPKTGDTTSALPFILLAITAAAAAGTTVAVRRREE